MEKVQETRRKRKIKRERHRIRQRWINMEKQRQKRNLMKDNEVMQAERQTDRRGGEGKASCTRPRAGQPCSCRGEPASLAVRVWLQHRAQHGVMTAGRGNWLSLLRT